MLRHLAAALIASLVTGACTPSTPPATTPASRTSPALDDTARIRVATQAIVDDFAARVAVARGSALGAAPRVTVRNTPQLIGFADATNQVTVPWWSGSPPEMRAIFRTFARGTDAEAERFFAAFFNGFLVAHEMGHWVQWRAGRVEPTLYANERVANRLAVAYWRTRPDGEARLAEWERLAAAAAAALVDPTPPGVDAVTHFGANYETLAADTMKYGYYQFRFMRDAMRERASLDFAALVR